MGGAEEWCCPVVLFFWCQVFESRHCNELCAVHHKMPATNTFHKSCTCCEDKASETSMNEVCEGSRLCYIDITGLLPQVAGAIGSEISQKKEPL